MSEFRRRVAHCRRHGRAKVAHLQVELADPWPVVVATQRDERRSAGRGVGGEHDRRVFPDPDREELSAGLGREQQVAPARKCADRHHAPPRDRPARCEPALDVAILLQACKQVDRRSARRLRPDRF